MTRQTTTRSATLLPSRMARGLVLLLCCLVPTTAQGQYTSEMVGRDFWVTMLLNYSHSFNTDSGAVISSGGRHELYVAGATGTTVQIANPLTGWSTASTIGVDGWTKIPLPRRDTSFLAQPVNEAFHVTADSAVSVTALNTVINTTDAAAILSTRGLGTHYVVQDYPGSGTYFGCQVALLAVEDSTLVTFRVKAEVMGGLLHAGDTVRQWLMQGEVFRLMTWNQRTFSGMEITSNGKPFALFEGHDCNFVPGDGTTAMDHLYEQALPVPLWGQEYVLVPTCGRSNGSVGGDRVKVTAADSCTVSLNGVPIDTLGPLQSLEFSLPAGPAWRLASTAPICAIQYLTSNEYGGEPGDPASVMVTPTDRGVRYAAFTTFDTPWTSFTSHYVNIAAPTATLNGLMLDATPIAEHFIPMDSLYSYACIEVGLGRHTLENGSGTFVAHVYGLEHDESYAYNLGLDHHVALYIEWHDTVCQGADYEAPFIGLPPTLTQETGTFHYTRHEDSEDTLWDYSLTLTVLPSYETVLYDTLEPGDTLHIADTVIAEPGTYTFHLTTTHGCDSALTLHVASCMSPPCVDLSRPFIDFDHPVVTFTDCTEGSVASRWLFSDGSVYTGSPLRRQFHHPLPDSLEVTLHTCNQRGCCADTTFSLGTWVLNVWFPNAFTPDEESNNRFGCVTTMTVEDYELTVFNRQGQAVFHTTDPAAMWDGTYNGKKLPQGAYVYHWTLRDNCDYRGRGTGTITLIR